jgi:hypothetical protein
MLLLKESAKTVGLQQFGRLLGCLEGVGRVALGILSGWVGVILEIVEIGLFLLGLRVLRIALGISFVRFVSPFASKCMHSLSQTFFLLLTLGLSSARFLAFLALASDFINDFGKPFLEFGIEQFSDMIF